MCQEHNCFISPIILVHNHSSQNVPFVPMCSKTPFSPGLKLWVSMKAENATTGEFLWRLQLRSGALNSSPIYADGRIYVLSEQGTTTVFKPSSDPKVPAEIIATNKLDEEYCRATIAVAGKQLIIRAANRLWCIGK
jgi:hypothetical protein